MSGVDHAKPLKTAGLDVFDVVALVEYHVVIAEPDQRGKSYNPAPEKCRSREQGMMERAVSSSLFFVYVIKKRVH